MFSDLHKQIKILSDRHMSISDDEATRKLLIDHNYYNVINGFKDPFLLARNPDDYKPGTTFNEIFALYDLDRKLRSLFLTYILMIENSIKTKIAYEFASLEGEDKYDNFLSYDCTNEEKKADALLLISKIIKNIADSKNNGIYKHFIGDNKKIPIWALVNFFDFGTMRNFYECLKDKERFNVANYFLISPSELFSLLSAINMFRNVCAHDNRLMKYIIFREKFRIADLPIHANLHITRNNNKYSYGKKDLFALIVSFKYLLSEDDFKSFFDEFKKLIDNTSNKITTISKQDIIKEYGLPLANPLTGQLSWDNILSTSK